MIQGTVKRILTSSNFYSHEIKVELENGKIGRVQRISQKKLSRVMSLQKSLILTACDAYQNMPIFPVELFTHAIPYVVPPVELSSVCFLHNPKNLVEIINIQAH
ncbi:MAG: DUF2196 domain-containing protein [Thaumarchaeota archaeon]|nr:DUF2196 domain-containing protein [Nitrososphaerota archaeon]